MCVRLTWQGRATLENFTRAIPLISGANNGTNNGWENDNGGGLEDIGATQAIHLMLLQTVDEALVLFLAWPTDSPASFTSVREKASRQAWQRGERCQRKHERCRREEQGGGKQGREVWFAAAVAAAAAAGDGMGAGGFF